MGKRRRKMANSRRRTHIEFHQIEFHQNPLERPEVFHQGLPERSGAFNPENEDRIRISRHSHIQRLNEMIRVGKPDVFMVSSAVYNLVHKSEYDLQPESGDETGQFHIEWLQALCLTHEGGDFIPSRVPVFYRGGPIFELVKEIALETASLDVLSSALSIERDPNFRRNVGVTTSVRAQTRYLRNWGHSQQITRMSHDLLVDLDDLSKKRIGLAFSIFPDLFHLLIKTIEDRINQRYNELAGAIREVIPRDPSVTVRDVLNYASTHWNASPAYGPLENDPIVTAIFDIFEEFEQRLTGDHTFTLEDVVAMLDGKIERAQARELLDSWSMRQGEAKLDDFDKMTRDNPIWQRPLVAHNDGTYLLPIPGLLNSRCLDLVLLPLWKIDPDRVQRARSKFLEKEVASHFRCWLPDFRAFNNVHWTRADTNDDVESDLLVENGDILLVVESKASRPTDDMRSGSFDRIKKAVADMVVKPSQQSLQFVEEVLTRRSGLKLTSDGVAIDLEMADFRNIGRLSVVLDSYEVSDMGPILLRDAGLIPSSVILAPTVTCADLESILVALPSQLQRIHYLLRRQSISCWGRYYADEMDLLAFYISPGFNRRVEEDDYLAFNQMGKALEPYLAAHYAKRQLPSRPERQLHNWFRKELDWLEREQADGWISKGMLLLDAGIREQEKFLSLGKVSRNKASKFARTGHLDDYQAWHLDLSTPWTRTTLLGIALPRSDVGEMDSLAQEAIARLEIGPDRDCLVIVFTQSKPAKPIQYFVSRT